VLDVALSFTCGGDRRFFTNVLHPEITLRGSDGEMVIMVRAVELNSARVIHCGMIAVGQQRNERDRVLLNGWIGCHE